MREHRNFTETASDEANFRMLQAGRVDYVVASFVNGMRLISPLGLEGDVQPLSARSLKEDDMYVIFSRHGFCRGSLARSASAQSMKTDVGRFASAARVSICALL